MVPGSRCERCGALALGYYVSVAQQNDLGPIDGIRYFRAEMLLRRYDVPTIGPLTLEMRNHHPLCP